MNYPDDAALSGQRRLISVVVPALNEADNVPLMLKRFAQFPADHPEYDFELVLVDDGSNDTTAELVLSLASPADRVTVVRLARTFGAHYAITAGMSYATGDCALVFGADMQEPPSLLADFIQKWEAGFEVVWGVRSKRADQSGAQQLVSKAFSKIFTRYANLANYPADGPSTVLIDRCVIDELERLGEHNRNVLALIAWLGFNQTRVYFDQQARRFGKSRWTRSKMIKLAVDSLIQFSSMPMRLFSLSGLTVAALGLIYAVVLVVRSIIGVDTPTGWPTVIVLVLVLGGMQLTVMGIMGEYLWRGVDETRNRPLYVVRDIRRAGPDLERQNAAPRQHSAPTAYRVTRSAHYQSAHSQRERMG